MYYINLKIVVFISTIVMIIFVVIMIKFKYDVFSGVYVTFESVILR